MSRTVGDTLSEAIDVLRASGVETPHLDAQLLLAHAVGRSRLDLIAHPELELFESQDRIFRAMLDERSRRCPLAYLVGYREFYGLRIEVSRSVLVPRPETELLVEETIRRVGTGPVRIADIGTGSGAVAVALAANLPDAEIYGVDISSTALEVAGHNVAKHHLSGRVRLLEGSLCEPLAGIEFDAVVSNPPYIPADQIESLQPEVAKWEPRGAMDGGPDGLDVIRRLLPDARTLLKAGGFAAIEVGMGQADSVRRIAGDGGYCQSETRCDLAGIERIVICQK